MVKLPDTSDLCELVEFVRRLDWGGSTNFHRVVKLFEDMPQPPKKILVFSDMQFAAAGGNTTVLFSRTTGRPAGPCLSWCFGISEPLLVHQPSPRMQELC